MKINRPLNGAPAAAWREMAEGRSMVIGSHAQKDPGRRTPHFLWLGALLLGLTGCAANPPGHGAASGEIHSALDRALAAKPAAAEPGAVQEALLPPLQIPLPKAAPRPVEPHFDLVVNDAPASQVFMGIVSGTRYSMLVHPKVTGTISVNLKDVTVLQALDAIHELYGYDYKVDGNRIFVLPRTLQTRIFQVNYLTGQRQGSSDIRVVSGSVSDVSTGGSGGTATPTTPTTTSTAVDSSKISTTSSSDFWSELKTSLSAIVGNKDGRQVVISPQSGVVVVRAMPDELNNVAAYLKATQLSVDRQVILEAKIIEVTLNDSYQTGINWAAFKTGPNSRLSLGQATQGGTLAPDGSLQGTLVSPSANKPPQVSISPGANLQAPEGLTTPDGLTSTGAAASLFSLAFQTSSFAALISFLETQGTVHVLSSPRIATLNNQQAVLKVGSDEFFVTNISSSTTATAAAPTASTNVTVQPFFSGIALDVTPQIDEKGDVILHIHPSVSQVRTDTKEVSLSNLNGQSNTISLPLAKSTVSETDSIVRAQDGRIVAIGGLMRISSNNDRSQLPGLGNVPVLGALFGQTNRVIQKSELVILLKPTVIRSGGDWTRDIAGSRRRIDVLDGPRESVVGEGWR